MDVFSVKKVLLGGTAVAAAVLLAMSAAWACSPYGDRAVTLQGGGEVAAGPPGSRIVVQGVKYQEEYGPVTIELTSGSDWGVVLERPVLEYTHTATTPHPVTGLPVDTRFHKFTANVTVPLDAQGFVFVFQRSSAYGIKKSGAVFTVQATEAPVTTTTQLAPVTTLGNTAPAVTTPQTPPPPGAAVTPAPQTGPRSDAVAPEEQRAAVPLAPGVIEGGGALALDSNAPLTRAVPQTGVNPPLPPWMDPSELDRQTLWSGLEKTDGSAASLTGPTQPVDDPSRLGAGLLTLGALLLVAGGLVALPGRRARARARVRGDAGW